MVDSRACGRPADSIQQWKMEMENKWILILVLHECLMVNMQCKCITVCVVCLSNKAAKK